MIGEVSIRVIRPPSDATFEPDGGCFFTPSLDVKVARFTDTRIADSHILSFKASHLYRDFRLSYVTEAFALKVAHELRACTKRAPVTKRTKFLGLTLRTTRRYKVVIDDLTPIDKLDMVRSHRIEPTKHGHKVTSLGSLIVDPMDVHNACIAPTPTPVALANAPDTRVVLTPVEVLFTNAPIKSVRPDRCYSLYACDGQLSLNSQSTDDCLFIKLFRARAQSNPERDKCHFHF